jgi:hypothetical protein
MSIFKGHFAASIQENHQFFCDERLPQNQVIIDGVSIGPTAGVKILKQLVLTSFTRSSCSTIFNGSIKYIKNAGLGDYSKLNPNQTIINNGIGSFVAGKYTKFDKGSKSYENNTQFISWSEIENLIIYHEERQFDSNFPEDEDKEEKLKDINTSLEQGIIIEVNITISPNNSGDGEDSDTAQSNNVYFKLTFFNRSSRSNSREIAAPASMVFAGTPSRPSGPKYSYSNSTNFQSQSKSNLGSITPADERNKFSQDSVAAPLKMHFDSNSNSWEAGTTQILARLLTDVEPAQLGELPQEALLDNVVPDPQAIINACTPFTVGSGMPLNLNNGNPYTLGADYIECADKKLSKIRVINRSAESYKLGSTVVLSQINNK